MAEDLASSYLSLRGFRVVSRNLRTGPREIDLLARYDDWLVVVEVRFRSDSARGTPAETVRSRKREHLLRAGRACWLRHGGARVRLRFDLISILFTARGMMLHHYPHFLIPDRSR